MEIINPKPGQLKVRAYCGTCNTLLMESNPMTKAQLIKLWDRAVLGAISIKCEKCGHKFPNFDIVLKIANIKLNCEYDPKKYIKLPKKHDTPEELFQSVSKRWLKEHPDIKEPTPEEVQQTIEQNRKDNKTVKERLQEVVKLRNLTYAESGTNSGPDSEAVQAD